MPGPALVGVLGVVGAFIARFVLVRLVLALGLFGLNTYILSNFLQFVNRQVLNAFIGAPPQYVGMLMGSGLLDALAIITAAYLLVLQINALKYAVMGGATT